MREPPCVALVSNLAFPINGRDYGSEDRLLSEQLSARGFHVQLVLPETLFPVSPEASVNDQLLNGVDAIFCRNNYGGKLEADYRAALHAFYCRHEQRWKVFNDFGGCKGDYCGKQHLLDLFAAGFPVIPSTIDVGDLDSGDAFNTAGLRFMVKSMTGADSNGIKKDLTADQVRLEFSGNSDGFPIPDPLLQPMIDFSYEVSFFFFEGEFMFAMYNGEPDEGSNTESGSRIGPSTTDSAGAGDCAELLHSSALLPDADETVKRWSLRVYDPTEEDMAFALKFVDWNGCLRQIQRIDACRLRSSDGESRSLLLMEVEDYNCWLSLGDLQQQRPDLFKHFIDRLAASLHTFIAGNKDKASS